MYSRLTQRIRVRLIPFILAYVMVHLLCAPFVSLGAIRPRLTSAALPAGPTSTETPIKAVVPESERSTTASYITAPPMMMQSPANDPDFATARVRPANETGKKEVTLGSRNFNWTLPILKLPGRAGMDLDLTLYYNSLIWTKQGTTTKIGLNKGFPFGNGGWTANGFELHLPYLQQRYQNQDHAGWAYLLVLPSGGRVELRQIGTSNIYESVDGLFTQVTDNGTSGAIMRTKDGMQYTFGFNEMGTNQFGQPVVKGRKCTQIKDRNGNFITAAYTTAGTITSITDTLGRVVNFNFDPTTNRLMSITQLRDGVTYTFASFTYTNLTYSVNFVPPDAGNNTNGAVTGVITQINLPDGTYHRFDYNGYGQVYRITKYAPDGHALNYSSYNLPLDNSVQQSDCPRFTERHDWAENWNGGNEVITYFSTATDGSWSQQVNPDGTTYKEFFAITGWQKGLLTGTETWFGGVKKKWSSVFWTQDDTTLTLPKNPRVTETNIYDSDGNRRRATFNYGPYVSYNLPYEVIEYDNDGSTMLRHTYTDYNLSTTYTSRRIIGLISAVHVVDHASGAYVSKTTFDYDDGGEFLAALPQPATQHDATNFGASFVAGRGNVSATWRWDVTDINNSAKALPQRTGYNAAGCPVFQRNALGQQTTNNYADSFSDGVNRNTFAYTTTVTDADNFSFTTQYNFNHGGVTRTQDPLGAVKTLTYDAAGRIDRTTDQFSGAYVRWVYGAAGDISKFETIQTGLGEAATTFVFDGAGRPRGTRSELPNSTGGYRAQLTFYDTSGRVSQQTSPAEVNSAWVPVGDDAAGWVSTYQAYDWNSRPTVTTNPDNTTREKQYGGCGCAGGEVVTQKDEQGRRRRLTMDVFGRLKQVQELNWDQTVYATTNYTYNSRDQITTTNQSGQTRTINYDGYGRVLSRITPEQGLTTYSYFGDDKVQTVTDARNSMTTFGYNNRRLITSISYVANNGTTTTPNVTFGYDAAGNKTSMTDGLGSVSYVFNTISQLTSETRTFTGLGSYTLNYGYSLNGQLSSITNPWGAQVGYGFDKVGRTTNVSGSGYAGVSSYVNSLSYRAFGAKQIAYNDGRTLSIQYDNRMRPTEWSIPSVLRMQYNYTWELDGRVGFARNLDDETLDRYYGYDHVGRLTVSRSGNEARLAIGDQVPLLYNGPYSHNYFYDQFGNITQREGWGGTNPVYSASYTNNKLNTMTYDAAGNLTDAGGGWTFTYDVTGQQTASAVGNLQNWYDGERLRGKKSENGAVTYYLRSTALGGQVVAELAGNGDWARGYVYLGQELLAVQSAGVYWVHQDPVVKSKRITNSAGTIVSTVELDPWGGETNRSSNEGFQPKKFTSYIRDSIASDDAMHRRYNRWWSRFEQPDPYDGSYSLSDPQSFNRYAYTQSDPVNFVDPNGLLCFAVYVVTSTIIGNTTVREQWQFQYVVCNGSYSTPPPRDAPLSRLVPSRMFRSQIVFRQATPEQIRQQNLDNCIKTATQTFEKSFNDQMNYASNPARVELTGASSGFVTNLVMGSSRLAAGVNVIGGSQGAKMLQSYWELAGPTGFGQKFKADVEACNYLWGK